MSNWAKSDSFTGRKGMLRSNPLIPLFYLKFPLLPMPVESPCSTVWGQGSGVGSADWVLGVARHARDPVYSQTRPTQKPIDQRFRPSLWAEKNIRYQWPGLEPWEFATESSQLTWQGGEVRAPRRAYQEIAGYGLGSLDGDLFVIIFSLLYVIIIISFVTLIN